ncbi:hypothetical protein B0T10DRAFT_461957 [Thelonectria olida]|uniref:Uncharacterized protein n=1 Tax=Thelonectria olida TaxID=1576542 RepID=A0A9P8W0E0_9HYPO|nr:hypothetical protein B0T10DRAFT_461957 [Thelonectria olida]
MAEPPSAPMDVEMPDAPVMDPGSQMDVDSVSASAPQSSLLLRLPEEALEQIAEDKCLDTNDVNNFAHASSQLLRICEPRLYKESWIQIVKHVDVQAMEQLAQHSRTELTKLVNKEMRPDSASLDSIDKPLPSVIESCLIPCKGVAATTLGAMRSSERGREEINHLCQTILMLIKNGIPMPKKGRQLRWSTLDTQGFTPFKFLRTLDVHPRQTVEFCLQMHVDECLLEKFLIEVGNRGYKLTARKTHIPELHEWDMVQVNNSWTRSGVRRAALRPEMLWSPSFAS